MRVHFSVQVPYALYSAYSFLRSFLVAHRWSTGTIYLVWTHLLCIPLTSIIHRAIVTPYCLPWCDIPLALRVLLSPSERRQPHKLYRTHGLLTVETLRLCVLFLVQVIIPYIKPLVMGTAGPWLHLGVSIAITLASTAVLAPLEVVSARLMVQRNDEDDDLGALENGRLGRLVAEFGASSEKVVHLPDERYPYLGFWDALKRTAKEEGVGALYRGWWVTMLLS